MDLRQLEAFAAVMSAGSVTGAGQMLGRSQPTVTRLIQELEQELGFALFERSGPKVTPTQKAFMLSAEVENALQGVRHVQQRALNIARDENLSLRLVATPALASGLLPPALAQLPPGLQPQQLQIQSLS
ncbi:LysR family transcriptional regulator, partial [Pseudomonas sp. FSL R10-0765]|nr:LysR family transcriptional regulator [Pseudomonas sp. FSL R10-0765]